MPTRYICSCGQNIVLPTGTAGRRARCRGCGADFTVPWPQEQEQPIAVAYAPAHAQDANAVEEAPFSKVSSTKPEHANATSQTRRVHRGAWPAAKVS